MSHAMHFQTVRLQGASLGERFLAKVAFIRSDTCVSSRVALEIKGVVESFAAVGAQVSLGVRVVLHVPV